MSGRSGSSSILAPLRVREFRALWFAELLSVAGDQLARVALAVLVFDRTDSALLTALTYALTFVPSVLGGFLLSGLADRFPRRAVLVVTDFLRAGIALLMAVPGLPLPVLWACVALLSVASGPFKAASMALLPHVVPGERYAQALALRQVTGQSAQLAGFAGGGALLVVLEPHLALGLNALTFLISAILVRFGVRHRPSAVSQVDTAEGSGGTDRRKLVVLYALVSLIGLYVVPEGLAAPYADGLGAAAVGVGLLLAADPLGSAVGAWLVARFRIPASPGIAAGLAAAGGVPLVLCGLAPGLVLSILCWAASGVFSTAYLLQTQTMVVEAVPDHRLGTVMGRMATVLYCSQGVAVLLAGLAADAAGPVRVIAAAGALSVISAAAIGFGNGRVRPRRGGGPEFTAHQSLLPMAGTSSQRMDCRDASALSMKV
ncbi:MFS transporter [Amycolatopsis sp. YIM 10]|uniref:MFS transporter n=1 Tax=Amycolatopsis sp. YIM 10 TaxID=2653857 RepID=UPI00129011E8|nr:MFS transporter [Amycolatopsis sp. YIM 10]QFU89070.1 enterobactin exporter EntS [Amycolatopsis sp. YIM 10]